MKFFCTALGHFNEITGYFWGFVKKHVYRFDVNEIQFTFELAFDNNGKDYPTLFNAYPCGLGITKTDDATVTRQYKDRFLQKEVSDHFLAYVRRGCLTNEKYIGCPKYDFKDYEYYRQHKLEPVPTDCGNFRPAHQSRHAITRSINETSWTHRYKGTKSSRSDSSPSVDPSSSRDRSSESPEKSRKR